MASSFNVNAYCRNQPELRLFPAPVVANRAPSTADKNFFIGQLWIQPKNTSGTAVNGAWVLTSIINNLATWEGISGAAGVFTTLTVTGQSTLAATTIVGTTLINASGSAATTIGTGGTGAVNIGNSTGNTSVTGTLTSSAGITASTGNIVATAGAVNAGTSMTATLGNITATNGNLVLGTAGNKLSIATGANASMGTSVAMTAGTVTVSTTAVTASSKIFLSVNTPGGTQGVLSAPTASIVAGTSFVINSSNAADTSTVNWLLIN